MTTYLLNSPVLTQFGDYRYQSIDLAAARSILAAGFTSAVGHESTAEALQALLELSVPCNRVSITMQAGDKAVVYRLKNRPPAGQVLSREDLLLAESEWGLLVCLKEMGQMPSSPESSVFVSYDRNHWRQAEQIATDLQRAGIDTWIDRRGIAQHDDDWESTILANIRSRDQFLLLASPESAMSQQVAAELAEADAAGKRVRILHVGGELEKLPDTWKKRQITDFTYAMDNSDYESTLRGLIAALPGSHTAARFFSQSILSNETVAGAADELGSDQKFEVDGTVFRRLPLSLSGYTMSWLVAPAEQPLPLPGRLALLVKCSGDLSRGDTVVEVARHRVENNLPQWILYLQGHLPKNARKYELPVRERHIWDDVVQATKRLLQKAPWKGRPVDIYFDAPAALAFEVGACFRQMGDYRVFQYDYSATYHEVISHE